MLFVLLPCVDCLSFVARRVLCVVRCVVHVACCLWFVCGCNMCVVVDC